MPWIHRSAGMWSPAAALLAICAAGPAAAAPAAAGRLEVFPNGVRLDGRRAERQLVVTGYLGGTARDLTHAVEYLTSDPGVATVRGGRVRAAGAGRAVITVRWRGRMARVPVMAAARPDPVRFRFETLAVLTKQGCASGSCHGSPHGKGGFSLSLFGYDPRVDQVSLTRDGFNRRINVMEPAESLLLKKPLLEIPHVGGRRLRRGDTAYRVLHDWIYNGASVEIPGVECVRIAVQPGSGRVLEAPYRRQQLSVLAHFSDGSSRDVTAIATYESSHPAVAAVDPDGLVTGRARGQSAVSVRYLDHLESVHFTVVEPVPGFVWRPVPESGEIDRLVHARLRQLGYQPSGTCTDEVFLRRVYLDLTGLLPTAARAREFLADRRADHPEGARARLIDALLETEEYARFWALKRADLMRVSPRRLKAEGAERFAAWLADSVRRNVPYDRFARELLTAAGEVEQVAAASYFLAIPGMEERTEMTAQLFMGSRLECAKCHNHPFENWTMRDYYRIAAVFARTRAEDGMVVLADSGEAKHPTTGEVMAPWGSDGAPSAEDRRARFAAWLTRPGNPLFARVEANRIWAELLGRGIVDPVDDFRSSNPPSNVPLLDALAREFERSGFDRKHLIRLICSSRTYQRESATHRFNEREDTLFSHARVRLLSAEQLKDAIGLVARTLEAPDRLAEQTAALRGELEARDRELLPGYPAWRAAAAGGLAGLPVRPGGVYTAAAAGGGAAEMPPPPVPGDAPGDAQRAPGAAPGAPEWRLRAAYRDGVPLPLPESEEQRTLVYRRLRAAAAGSFELFVQARGARAWLNGRPVTPQPGRGEQRLVLALEAGENHLVLSAAGGPGATLRMRLPLAAGPSGSTNLPPHLADWLERPEVPAAKEAELREVYLQSDARRREQRQQLTRLERRSEYATQRAYPEPTSFTSAFGQPARETACTCERQTAPTLLQALELLNGGTAHQAARQAAERYAELADDALVEELYLAALARRPRPGERAPALAFLKRSPARDAAITDLVWTLVNTQEFLFQH